MKYKFLLKILRSLVYAKRFFWWLGDKTGFLFLKLFGFIWHPIAYFSYKTEYLFKKNGVGREKVWWLKRDTLQLVLLSLLFIIALPQTKAFSRTDNYLAGQKTVAYRLFGQVENFEDIEEVSAIATAADQVSEAPTYKSGTIINDSSGLNKINVQIPELGLVIAGGVAVTRPIIIPGASIAGENRKDVIEYEINPGDSLSSIAYRYGVSVASILWANDLTARSIIRPGDKLKIPPVSGVIHTIKKGDTLSKIALKYGVDEAKIIKFNLLKESGADLVVGENIIIPDGVMPQVYVAPRSVYSSYAANIPTPASSSQAPTVSGFVWPSAARIITQYYSWRHTGLDIAGPMSTAIYAAKSGTVEKSQCGWNGGYGCYIIINHGGGVKTLYGHNSKLLVSAGDYVSAGQTISLMGNTGRVYGVTGIHLHFEVIINGTRRNPLSYVK